jgi:hypothetical protein
MKIGRFGSAAIGALALATTLVGSVTYADADPLSVPAGPFGICPPGYSLGRGRQGCWIRQIRPGPHGGCPQNYHLGPQDYEIEVQAIRLGPVWPT